MLDFCVLYFFFCFKFAPYRFVELFGKDSSKKLKATITTDFTILYSSQPLKGLVNMWHNWSSQISLIVGFLKVDLELLPIFGRFFLLLLRFEFWFVNTIVL